MTVERVIAAPIKDVFTWLTTTTNYTASPLILRCRLTRHGESTPYGVGAVRSHLWLIGWFRERITSPLAPESSAPGPGRGRQGTRSDARRAGPGQGQRVGAPAGAPTRRRLVDISSTAR
ncbi:hypothetical protein [Streptomyces platensis]|uniref:hypothetical protein n=1 Tax=Streptomyces platensis TaxID=58346 RepID=UPI00386D4217|nr:hypothetical protein OG962_04120 [Streptomyces platensis]